MERVAGIQLSAFLALGLGFGGPRFPDTPKYTPRLTLYPELGFAEHGHGYRTRLPVARYDSIIGNGANIKWLTSNLRSAFRNERLRVKQQHVARIWASENNATVRPKVKVADEDLSHSRITLNAL